MCANKFRLKQVPRKELLSRTRPGLPVRQHLLWQWQRLGSLSSRATWLSFLRKLHTKGPGQPLSSVWSITHPQLWNGGFTQLLSCGIPSTLASESSTQLWEDSVYPSVYIRLCLNLLFCPYQVGTWYTVRIQHILLSVQRTQTAKDPAGT